MKSIFSLIVMMAVCFFCCHLYFTNKNVQKSVDSAVKATRQGVKVCLKKGSEAL